MAALDDVKVLSSPQVLWGGRTLKIVPNSFEFSDGGSAKPRAVSSGGNTVSLVYGVDVSEMIATGKFTVVNTAANSDLIDSFVNQRNNGEPTTLRVVENGIQYAWQGVIVVNKPTNKFAAEGDIDIEWAGEMRHR
jgi:hypothetical protein